MPNSQFLLNPCDFWTQNSVSIYLLDRRRFFGYLKNCIFFIIQVCKPRFCFGLLPRTRNFQKLFKNQILDVKCFLYDVSIERTFDFDNNRKINFTRWCLIFEILALPRPIFIKLPSLWLMKNFLLMVWQLFWAFIAYIHGCHHARMKKLNFS